MTAILIINNSVYSDSNNVGEHGSYISPTKIKKLKVPVPPIKGPFISRQAEIIYYLTKLEGKQRNKALGMSDDIYEDPEKAKEWYRGLVGLVHPDKGGDEAAFVVLKKLYEVAIDHKDGENL